MKYVVFIFLTLIFFYLYSNKYIDTFVNVDSDDKLIWSYIDYDTHPDYIKLCIKTLKKHCGKDFKIIILDSSNINKYIDKPLVNKVNPNFKQYIKIYTLYKYGGLWIDLDFIILKNLSSFYNKLEDFDFIGFDCLSKHCRKNFDYYKKPTDSIIICKKELDIMKICLDEFIKTNTDSKNIFLFRNILWDQLKVLKLNYYHVNPNYIGSRDIDNDLVTVDRLIQDDMIQYKNINDLYLIELYADQIENSWFYKLSYDDILSSDTVISYFFRRSLFNNPNYNLPLIFKKNIGVYVLYVEKREEHIRKTINKLFLNPNFVKGPDKNLLNIEKLQKKLFLSNEWKSKVSKFNLGRVACHLGHTTILKKFLETTLDYALIFEDDIHININSYNEIRNKVKHILNNIPSDADIIYLSYCFEKCNNLKRYDDIFDISIKPLCRHMYLVSRKGANIIIDKTLPMYKPGDNMISDLVLTKELKSYSVNQNFFNVIQDKETFGSNLNNNTFKMCGAGHQYKI